MTTDDRPRAEFRHPWRLLALALVGWALVFAWAFAQDADADTSGIVVACAATSLPVAPPAVAIVGTPRVTG